MTLPTLSSKTSRSCNMQTFFIHKDRKQEENKPLCGKLNDGVELALQSSWTFTHFNVLAVFSDWRVDLSLGPGLGLL